MPNQEYFTQSDFYIDLKGVYTALQMKYRSGILQTQIN